MKADGNSNQSTSEFYLTTGEAFWEAGKAETRYL